MKKIAILTSFDSFNSGYSLTTIVLDQTRMLVNKGHEVHIFTNEGCELPTNYNIEKDKFHSVFPKSKLVDYKSISEVSEEHRQYSDKVAKLLIESLSDFDLVFTHDFIFTGWNLPYGLSIKKATPYLPKVKWLNWVHSIPTADRDWWRIKSYGPHHRIIYPNKSDSELVVAQYKGQSSDLRVIPHIKDLRSLMEFSPITQQFITDHPKIFEADIVQVYPASSDRFEAKGIDKIIHIMSEIEARKFSTFTVVVNQHANNRTLKDDISSYERKAKRNGLNPDKDFIFTSSWNTSLEAGLPHKSVVELLQCSNVFIYPTREESFGLIGPEAVLAGGCIVVLNQLLPMMMEVHGGNGIYARFKSFNNNWEPPVESVYYKYLANFIIGQYRHNTSAQHRTFIRRRYNWNYIYDHDYFPVFIDSELW